MIDLRVIRERPDFVRAEIAKLNTDAPVDRVLALDERRRGLLGQVEALRAERNAVSKEIGRMKDAAGREAKIAEMREVGDRISALDEQVRQVEAELELGLLEMPNLPDPSVPVGPDDSANVILRTVGKPRTFEFEPLPHWELGTALGILDFERGIKISGSRFYILKGWGARLQRALIAWFLDLHVLEQGYTEIYPPYLVKRECLIGDGKLPKFADTMYHDDEDDLWMIGTAETPLTNLHREEILEPGALPLDYVAYSACFRREKMSAGRDVRGIKRGHQFDKVEMYKYTEPEKSNEALEKLLADAEEIPRRLGIPHRVVMMCTGDLGFTASKKYDVEMWAPGVGEWLEVSSCSNCTDFQARRANIRFRRELGARPEFVHTLNGSGLALPRTMIAVMENYQQADGSIVIPDVLRPYMGGADRIGG